MDSSAKTQHKHKHNEEEEEEEENEEDTYSFAMQLAMSIVLPASMQAAAELGVFEIIAKAGPGAKLSAAQIAAQMPSRNPNTGVMLDRILRLLVTNRVLRCSLSSAGDNQRLYSLAPVAKYFVLNQDGVSLCPLLAMAGDQAILDIWYKLADAVLQGGIPFNKVHGMGVYEYAGNDSRFNGVLNKAMLNHTSIVMNRILDSYNGFEQIKQLVDVGGGLGVTLNIITSRYPHIEGVNFDLPHVIQNAPSYPGVKHIGGNMFERIPKGDAILMKWILHNWGDEHCLTLLKNCYEAIPENGKIIIIDRMPMVTPEATAAAREASMMDIIMLMQFSGGRERTTQEFMALANKAGFNGVNYECFACNFCIIEFIK
ncbi:Flavone 3'-O-methyltransferase 1 [Citrus sinensis]|uniref:anthranilate N-methyltransferase-like n=1 Tax=Citrus sinensis TaxID=2711 RepID=UPI00219EF368|nr:anthranilate N-methyltransferase-like [Citrus sinensis]KAH9727722.1 Flavone 3'-O-methyltransferase 1 [Citrus sinensis]